MLLYILHDISHVFLAMLLFDVVNRGEVHTKVSKVHIFRGSYDQVIKYFVRFSIIKKGKYVSALSF